MEMGAADEGPSEAARFTEVEESDCMDWDRCLFRLVEVKSIDLEEGEAAGDGRLMTLKSEITFAGRVNKTNMYS
jgi:hypothetical protein